VRMALIEEVKQREGHNEGLGQPDCKGHMGREKGRRLKKKKKRGRRERFPLGVFNQGERERRPPPLCVR